LDPDLISNALVEEKLLSEEEFDELREQRIRKKKVEFLLAKLPLKGPTAFNRFLKVLQDTPGQEFIAKKLEPRDKGRAHTDSGDGRATANNGHPEDQEAEEYDAAKLSDVYPMKAKPRGKALIINNKHFLGKMKVRTGTDTDANALELLFTWLSFDVERLDDQEAPMIKKSVHDLAILDHSNYDCVIVAILSHGEDGHIYGTDETLIPVADITGYFKSSYSLAGKPKLFFLQACRGGHMDSGIDVPDGFDDADNTSPDVQKFIENVLAEDEIDAALSTLPKDADFLLSYATTPGYVSWRNQANGSWYVQALNEVFRNHAHKEHLLDMLTMVNQKVATQYQSSTGKKKQIPGPVTMLTRKLYFKPGK
jgi:hypothetical protein